jgi:hypothetical protein
LCSSDLEREICTSVACAALVSGVEAIPPMNVTTVAARAILAIGS